MQLSKYSLRLLHDSILYQNLATIITKNTNWETKSRQKQSNMMNTHHHQFAWWSRWTCKLHSYRMFWQLKRFVFHEYSIQFVFGLDWTINRFFIALHLKLTHKVSRLFFDSLLISIRAQTYWNTRYIYSYVKFAIVFWVVLFYFYAFCEFKKKRQYLCLIMCANRVSFEYHVLVYFLIYERFYWDLIRFSIYILLISFNSLFLPIEKLILNLNEKKYFSRLRMANFDENHPKKDF